MSTTVAYQGKMKPVDLKGLTVDNWIQKKLGRTVLETSDSWIAELIEEYYGKSKSYFYDSESEILYKVKRVELEPESIMVANRKSDGSIDFLLSYYNGGCSFDEALALAIDNS